MSRETVARRYASALADVVMKAGNAPSIKSELRSWNELITSNSNLYQAFRNPSIAAASKARVLEDLIQRSNPTPTTANFLRVLLRNGRLTEIDEISKRFDAVLDERHGLASGQVISSRELSEAEKHELKQSLDALTGKNVSIRFDVDPGIIGGVIARVGSTVYDSSVRTQLQELREKLIKQ